MKLHGRNVITEQSDHKIPLDYKTLFQEQLYRYIGDYIRNKISHKMCLLNYIRNKIQVTVTQ